MAKAKTAAKKAVNTERKLESRALDFVTTLRSGARVDGFGLTSFDDDLFALGYPHLALLYDDEQDPLAAAHQLVLAGYPFRDVAFPRQAATSLARALPGGTCLQWKPDGTAALNDKALSAIARTEPIDLEELRALVAGLIASVDPSTDVLLYLYEALLGTVAVLEVVVEALVAAPTEPFFKRPPNAARWLDALVIMLDRAPAERAAPLLAKLCAWADAVGLAEPLRTESGVGTLHHEPLIAPPRPVVRAAAGDVARARQASAKQCWYTLPDPRLVFLGGDAVYAVELGLWSKYGAPYTPGVAHRLILERFGRIRSPRTVELAVAMSAKSKAKPAALAWLEANATFARPHLDALAGGAGPNAAAAAALLAKLG